MKTILGTGQLGVAVMHALLESNPNEQITLVSKSGRAGMELPETARIVAADVTDKNIMENIASRSEVIYSCADDLYQEWRTFYPATASALAHALSQSNAKLVFAGNSCSYSKSVGGLIGGRFSHKVQTKDGRMRSSLMDNLLRSGSDFNHRVAVVKAAECIGPGIQKGSFGIEFLDKLYHGKTITFFGSISLPHSFTYINDFARALVNVGTAIDTFGEIWHVPNAPAMSIDKWIHLFEVNAGRKVKLIALPKMFVRLAPVFNSSIAEFYDLAAQIECPYQLDHSKYASRFGNDVTYPSSIVKQTVQWYERENKQYEN